MELELRTNYKNSPSKHFRGLRMVKYGQVANNPSKQSCKER